MHIDTNSKTYKRIKDAIHWTGFAGGCVALDSVVLPYIEALFGRRFRFMRPIGYFGSWALSIVSGSVAANVVDEYTDAVVELINMHDAEKKQTNDEYVDWITKNKLTHEERVAGEVGQNHLFWFSDEDEVRYVTEKLWNIIQQDGYATLKDLIAIRNSLGSKYSDADDYSLIENPEMFGWRKEDTPWIEYTHTGGGRYVPNVYGSWDYLREAVKIVGITDIDKED